MKKERGITLIALVITIITLLILAGIAISMLSGENGVLKKAADAKLETERQEKIEKVKLAITAAMINENHTIEKGKLEEQLKKYFDNVTVEEENGFIIKIKDDIYIVDKKGILSEENYDISKKQSFTGDLIISDSNGNNLVDYKIYGGSVQDGTPTPDTPIEVESVGERTVNLVKDAREVFKDFANYTELEEDSRQCIRIKSNGGANAIFDFTFKENTQYTISFDFKCKYDRSGVSLSYDVPFSVYYTDGSSSPCSLGPIDDVWHKRTLTTIAGKTVSHIKAIAFDYRVYNYIDTNTFQIQEGNIATEYEPYGYKIPVVVKGKNLATAYDVCKKFDYYTEVIEDGKNCIRYLDANTTKANPFGFKENTQYTVSFDCKLEKGQWGNDTTTPTSYTMVFHYTDGTVGTNSTRDGIAMGVRGVWQTKTMTSQAGKTVAGIGTRSYQYENYNYIDVNTFQIEEGATATEYEPYIEPITTNIYLKEPLRKIGDYADYIDFKNQKVYRNVEVVDDTGTLTIQESYKGIVDNEGTDIDLPSIQTQEGTNIIEVNTKIKPSNIEVEYIKK